jgi:hypothetical protein
MITSDILAGAAGVLLSLTFSFVPGIAPWLAAKDPVWKRLTVLVAVVLVAAGAFGLSCANVTGLPFTLQCTASGAVGLVEAVIVCLVTSQATNAITPNVGAGKTAETLKEPPPPQTVIVPGINAVPPKGQ